jgi:hypothetical protein
VANIDLQRKEGQPPWVWIAAIVGLLVVAAVIWAVMSNGDDRDTMMPRDTVPADTLPAARDTPISWLDGSGEAVPESIVRLG